MKELFPANTPHLALSRLDNDKARYTVTVFLGGQAVARDVDVSHHTDEWLEVTNEIDQTTAWFPMACIGIAIQRK